MINHVIIIKTRVIIPQAYVTSADFGYSVKGLWFLCSQRHLNNLDFQIFWIWEYLMKIIPETRRAH